jgi:hypothetical protein
VSAVVEGNGHSRRSVLKRGLLVVAGAIGVTAAGKEGSAEARPLPNEFRLFGRSWRLDAPGRVPGEQIRRGDGGVVYGELVDAPTGKPTGRFFGSRLAVQSAPGGNVRADASVEIHTFVLPGGTLVGMGTALPAESVFAIVGGTGDYAGASGSYTAVQRLRELGGNGTAEFHVTLHRPEA